MRDGQGHSFVFSQSKQLFAARAHTAIGGGGGGGGMSC